VLPYRYASDTETDAVAAMIGRMAAGDIDLIAFTSSPQVQRLRDVAAARGMELALVEGLARARVAAVGPVVAAALAAIGVTASIVPARSFHMKPLVNAIAAAMAG
jgi:uroporphyrinogen-III synthase